jgi:hypothetical protein
MIFRYIGIDDDFNEDDDIKRHGIELRLIHEANVALKEFQSDVNINATNIDAASVECIEKRSYVESVFVKL